MASERLKQRLLKTGFEEEKLKDMSREDMLEALAEVWLKEEVEEEGAVGGAVEKVIEKPLGICPLGCPKKTETFQKFIYLDGQPLESFYRTSYYIVRSYS